MEALKRKFIEYDYEEISCYLNPVQSHDLKEILLLTSASRRLNVSLAFSGLTERELITKSGIRGITDGTNSLWKRWMRKDIKLPLGAAFRIAKVLGTPAEILFESFMFYRAERNDN